MYRCAMLGIMACHPSSIPRWHVRNIRSAGRRTLPAGAARHAHLLSFVDAAGRLACGEVPPQTPPRGVRPAGDLRRQLQQSSCLAVLRSHCRRDLAIKRLPPACPAPAYLVRAPAHFFDTDELLTNGFVLDRTLTFHEHTTCELKSLINVSAAPWHCAL